MLLRFRCAGLKTHSFAYFTWLEDFASIARRLAQRLKLLATKGPFIVIGHSLGGVLLREALSQLPPDQLPAQIFLLGSPVRSSRLARQLSHQRFFRYLTRDCGQLLASDERMHNIAPPPVPCVAIQGTCTLPVTARYFVAEANDGVVACSEASADWMDEILTVRQVHALLPGSGEVSRLILARLAR